MSATQEPRSANRWLDLIASDARAAWVIAGAFLVTTLSLALTRVYLHDEGLFPYDMARAFWLEPVAMAFFAKAKIVITAVNAIPAQLGLSGYLTVHAVLGAATLVLVIRAARLLGARYPNIAGLVLALSPEFIVASSNGYPNTTGAFFLALALFLLARGSRLSAGVVIGMLPFVRFELATVGLALLVWDFLRHRNLRTFFCATAFPAIYLVAGALYHGSALWLLETFPDPSGMAESIAGRRDPGGGDVLSATGTWLIGSAAANLGGLGLLAFVGWRPDDRPWQGLFVITWAILGLLVVLRLFGAFGFDASVRYHTAYMPLVAVLAAEGFARTSLRPWLIVAVLAVLMAGSPTIHWLIAIALVGFAALAADAPEHLRGTTRLTFLVAAVALPVAVLAGTTFEREQHLKGHAFIETLRAWGWHPDEPLYTETYAIRFEAHAGVTEAYTLGNAAVTWEVDHFTNAANGQREAIKTAFETLGLYVTPARLHPRRGALYVVRDHERSGGWREHLEKAGLQHDRLGDLKLYRHPPRATP